MDRVAVGEELTYTVRAVSHSPVPTHVSIKPFTGLELVGRSESTELAFGDPSTRTTILEIRLRAVRPGRWRVGPARAVQGAGHRRGGGYRGGCLGKSRRGRDDADATSAASAGARPLHHPAANRVSTSWSPATPPESANRWTS